MQHCKSLLLKWLKLFSVRMWLAPWVVKWWTNLLILRSLKKTKTETPLVYRLVKSSALHQMLKISNFWSTLFCETIKMWGGGEFWPEFIPIFYGLFLAYIIPKFLMLWNSDMELICLVMFFWTRAAWSYETSTVSPSVRQSQKFSYFLPLDFSDFLHQTSLL